MMEKAIYHGILFLLIRQSVSSYPDCSDPSTYSSYGKSTEYKGLNSNTAWDRTFNTGDTCDFSPVVPSVQPLTCGDCDFDLENGTWYRFEEGPHVQIKEYSDKTSCPARGHCNGYYQIALFSSDIPSNNSQSKMYHIVYSNAASQTDCIVTGDNFMVEEFYCGEFVLYKFPVGWKSSNTVCTSTTDDKGQIAPTPYSFCMELEEKKPPSQLSFYLIGGGAGAVVLVLVCITIYLIKRLNVIKVHGRTP